MVLVGVTAPTNTVLSGWSGDVRRPEAGVAVAEELSRQLLHGRMAAREQQERNYWRSWKTLGLDPSVLLTSKR